MIIDAAGGAGTVYHPHVKKQVHGEPERSSLLKTKSTFIKVHGYGNIILNNYFTGKQGLSVNNFDLVNSCTKYIQVLTLFSIVFCGH